MSEQDNSQPDIDDQHTGQTYPEIVNGRFENPWKSWKHNRFKDVIKFFKNRENKTPPKREVGPKRYRYPPCQIKDLPKIDAVVISHNHYDHLDVSSVKELNNKYGKDVRWYVPQGMKKWMTDSGCENVMELSWWEEDVFPGKGDVKFVCLPTQHWSRRTLTDRNKTLWCSWGVIGPRQSFYFAGDTGYCEGFNEIGKKYGPFTLAAIPIGCYKPREFLSPQHVCPSEAVQIHQDVRAQKSFGIHWGTFNMMAYEHYLAP